ncbi:MAG: hypothetical protein HY744_05295 [Deltaproteobacteria bacterium]|nr:hypothetical protein [Deltaproteobacteria bacterium]
MQKELGGAAPPVPISLLGVNAIGAEAGNEQLTSSVSIPWLQDVPEQDARAKWGAINGDVFVLGGDNAVASVYSLEQHPLTEPANYDALKKILLDTAAAE